MKRVDKVTLKVKNDKTINIKFYQVDYNYNDEIEYHLIHEINLNNDYTDFAIGCFEISLYPKNEKEKIEHTEKLIEEVKKEIKELKKKNNEKEIEYKKSFLKYLKRKKKEIEKAESLEEMLIDYDMGELTIISNGKSIKIKKDKELLFKNLTIKIEKF
jgi:tRNA U34 5-carboxymethylaminomethyl modifying enzyme MnmG/GidA